MLNPVVSPLQETVQQQAYNFGTNAAQKSSKTKNFVSFHPKQKKIITWL